MESSRLPSGARSSYPCRMQDTPTDFRSLIDRFPSASAFARTVAGEEHADKGKIWRRRNRVPVEYHARIVEICPPCGIQGVTLESLAAMRVAGRGEGY